MAPMKASRILISAMLLALVTGVCHGLDQVEIVVDGSTDMWALLGKDQPRIVALRTALNAFAASLVPPRGEFGLGLRVIGGAGDGTNPDGCDQTELLVPISDFDFTVWRNALDDLVPEGPRGLIQAARVAISDFSEAATRRRVVVVTAGDDACHADPAEILSLLGEGEDAIELRFVGLGLDHQTANELLLLAPTRNATTVEDLLEALRWATVPVDSRPSKPEWLDLRLDRDGETIEAAEVLLEGALGDDATSLSLEVGIGRVRVEPGIYRATIQQSEGGDVVIGGLSVGSGGANLELDITPVPPVTLEIDPPRPAAGGVVHIQYWGAPKGLNWVMVSAANSPPGEYLVRARADAPAGEVAMRIPDSLLSFEARFAHGLEDGAYRIVGQLAFETRLSPARLTVPERIENRTPLVIDWTGPDLPGDRITLAPAEGGDGDFSACLFTTVGTPLTLTSPVIPAKYMVRYVSSFGRVLARAPLEVYEVLAIVDGPAEVAPGEEFEVAWQGPADPQDYISLAPVEADNEEYLSWSPIDAAPSLRLRAPRQSGSYELRYVHAADGEVLARQPILVAAEAVSLHAPDQVGVGTRFEVEWTGTPGSNDFIAVAPKGAPNRRHLDWSYTSAGRPLSLAAPFKPGEYEVRYISGDDLKVIVSVPLRVR
jgi:Ca-activated chloride channel family protein